jgi:hypothetical protein
MPNDSVNIEKYIKIYLLNTYVFNVNPGNQGSPIIFVIKCQLRKRGLVYLRNLLLMHPSLKIFPLDSSTVIAYCHVYGVRDL